MIILPPNGKAKWQSNNLRYLFHIKKNNILIYSLVSSHQFCEYLISYYMRGWLMVKRPYRLWFYEKKSKWTKFSMCLQLRLNHKYEDKAWRILNLVMLKNKNLESLNNIPSEIVVIYISMYLGAWWIPSLYFGFNCDIIQYST